MHPIELRPTLQWRPFLLCLVGLICAHHDRAIAGREVETDAQGLVQPGYSNSIRIENGLSVETMLAGSPDGSST